MTSVDTYKLIDQLRRDMPRNQAVMDLCQACESLLRDNNSSKMPLTRAQIQKNYRDRKKLKVD